MHLDLLNPLCLLFALVEALNFHVFDNLPIGVAYSCHFVIHLLFAQCAHCNPRAGEFLGKKTGASFFRLGCHRQIHRRFIFHHKDVPDGI